MTVLLLEVYFRSLVQRDNGLKRVAKGIIGTLLGVFDHLPLHRVVLLQDQLLSESLQLISLVSLDTIAHPLDLGLSHPGRRGDRQSAPV